MSSLCGQGSKTPWPESSSLCCWHCTEPFSSQPIGIPIEVRDDRIICDGNFCSYSCALAHTFSAGASHREYKTKQLLTQVASEVHGIDDVVAAPPRLTLSKFGGPLSIEEFRGTRATHSVVVNPPFVSQDVVYEECDTSGEPVVDSSSELAQPRWDACNLTIPSTPLQDDEVFCESEPLAADALFPQFCADQEEEQQGDDAQEQQDGAFGGELGRFMRAQ